LKIILVVLFVNCNSTELFTFVGTIDVEMNEVEYLESVNILFTVRNYRGEVKSVVVFSGDD